MNHTTATQRPGPAPSTRDTDELRAWLRLCLTPGVGMRTARQLLAHFGLPDAVFAAPASELLRVVSSTQAQALLSEPATLDEQLLRTQAWLAEARGDVQRAVVTLGDALYPQALLALSDPPLMLYLMGQLDLSPGCAVAVVGSRNPTPQGTINAQQFAKALSQAGVCVVSGLALGIDGAAHEGAIQGVAVGATPSKPSQRLATIAVVGTGLDRVYPRAHHALAHRIAQHGWVMSEYPLGTPPHASNFPQRNRLIAALSEATLVVEAALESGSLITARLALDLGREVMAIPGSIHAPQAKGCHALIRQGAKLVESASDVLEELPLASVRSMTTTESSGDPTSASTTSRPETSNGALLQALGFEPMSLDGLQARTGLDIAHLQAELMTLELDGEVVRLPGGRLQRVVRG